MKRAVGDGLGIATTRQFTPVYFIQQFLEAIESGTVDVNMVDPVTGDAPIHSIVKMKKKNHTEFLFALLINTTVLVDLENRKKKTALLLALEVSILLH